MSDQSWVVAGIIVGAVAWFSAIIQGKRPSKRNQDSVEIQITGDAEVAVKTLQGFGYSEAEAKDLVKEAVKKEPHGNYEKLINTVIKQ